MFERQKVYSRLEVESRYEVKLENYVKIIDIEALSAIDIARRMILPAAFAYITEVSGAMGCKKTVMPSLSCAAEEDLLTKLNHHTSALYEGIGVLESVLQSMDKSAPMLKQAQYTRDVVIAGMNEVRAHADALETLVSAKHWPMPTYQTLLSST